MSSSGDITTVGLTPTGVGPRGEDPDGDGGGSGDSNDWPPGWSNEDANQPRKYRIGIWVALASILMLFMALTSAYVLRQAKGVSPEVGDWIAIRMPPILWMNTLIILVSSVTFEVARRALGRNEYGRFNAWIATTTMLGIAFLVGQLMAYGDLASQGIYLNTNPHSSFVYLLTGLHGLHLVGGVIGLVVVLIGALRMRISFKKRAAVDAAAIYWHFMDFLWIYIFVLLFFWR